MNLAGLLNLSSVDERPCEKIGKGQFVELYAIHKVDDVSSSINDKDRSSSVKSQQPKTRPEFFQLLYRFGQYYLQYYPKKSAAFLEYLSFMNKYGAVYPVTTLVKLDTSIRKFYTECPELNWDVTCPEVNRFITNANLDAFGSPTFPSLLAMLLTQKTGLAEAKSSFARGTPPVKKSLNFRSSPGYQGSPQNYADPNICRRYNWQQCPDGKKCKYEHRCIITGCKAYHTAQNCPKNKKIICISSAMVWT